MFVFMTVFCLYVYRRVKSGYREENTGKGQIVPVLLWPGRTVPEVVNHWCTRTHL